MPRGVHQLQGEFPHLDRCPIFQVELRNPGQQPICIVLVQPKGCSQTRTELCVPFNVVAVAV